LLVYGNPRLFFNYLGVQTPGLCRIFLDGTLDTTFQSPLLDTTAGSLVKAPLVLDDGSILIFGDFWVNGSNSMQTLIKCDSTGSLDPTFMNFSGPTDTLYAVEAIVTVAPEEDGGFIVGGFFNKYQGHAKRSIAKIDYNGVLEPQYFTSLGPDSSYFNGNQYTAINIIEKSAFGGFYVGGDFLKWDGQPSQPIIRITGLQQTVGLESKKPKVNYLKLYPNPTNGRVYLESENRINTIEVRNSIGQLIQEFQPMQNSFNWQLNEKKGIYIIRYLIENERWQSEKVIKL